MLQQDAGALRAQLTSVREETARTIQSVRQCELQAALAEVAHLLRRELKGAKEELAREKARLAHHRSLAALLGAQGVGIRSVHYIGEPDEIEFEAPDDDPF